MGGEKENKVVLKKRKNNGKENGKENRKSVLINTFFNTFSIVP